MRRKDPLCPTRARQVAALLENAGFTVLYPEQELKRLEREFRMPMYYRTDTHWNPAAGALVARSLFALFDPSVCRDMIPMTPENVQWRTLPQGDLLKMIHFPGDRGEVSPCFPSADAAYGAYRDQSVYYRIPENPARPNGKKVFLIGDSFANQVYPWLCLYSRQVVRYPYYEINMREIGAFQPDVVILETVERLLDRFLFLKDSSAPRAPAAE